VACVLIAGLCLGPTGCHLFSKKPPPPTAAPGDPLLPPRADPVNPAPGAERKASAEVPANPVVPTSTGSGILAGQVIDSFGRPPAEAYVLVYFPKQGGESERKPIDVAASAQGYFTITGLKPGRHYQLTARARDGNRMMAGSAWATAPNPRVLIRISEDFVTKNTPPVPPPPNWPGTREREQKTAAQLEQPRAIDSGEPERKVAADQSWGPARADGADPARVQPNEDQRPAVQVPPKMRPAGIVYDDDAKQRLVDGRMPAKVPDQTGPRQTPKGQWKPKPVAPAEKVPSCVLTGKQLINFALYDLDDKVWEFRNRTGRLVLLDFWGTRCMPCRQAIPHLKILQDRYRRWGLQIIGIACEEGGTAAQQRQLVDMVCQRLEINYKVLMGGPNGPVQTDFGVRYLPTMVLLDENGWIIFSHEGLPSAEEWNDLESKMQRWLGVR
jgi:thiol-disulfide isomerase/thioredoxin